jgi:hypothetical protein
MTNAFKEMINKFKSWSKSILLYRCCQAKLHIRYKNFWLTFLTNEIVRTKDSKMGFETRLKWRETGILRVARRGLSFC